MPDFLSDVAARTRRRLAVQKQGVSLDQLRKRLAHDGPRRSLRKALARPGTITLIAELKQASPSAGLIRHEQDIPGRIRAYEQGGAAALSILTEEDYFHGSPQLLEQARSLTQLPVLRKDFIVDPYQIYESRTLGADAILLMTSLLPGDLLRDFMLEAESIGLETLVEVHDEADLAHAIQAQAPLIGINNRNLRTLRVDCSVARKLLAKAPRKGILYVVESGIKAPSELPLLMRMGAQAVLIGETFMRAENPELLVKEFSLACQK